LWDLEQFFSHKGMKKVKNEKRKISLSVFEHCNNFVIILQIVEILSRKRSETENFVPNFRMSSSIQEGVIYVFR